MESGFLVEVAHPVGEVVEGLDVEDAEEGGAEEEDVGDVGDAVSVPCPDGVTCS